jgi:DNA-3-methyladenine glycosylase
MARRGADRSEIGQLPAPPAGPATAPSTRRKPRGPRKPHRPQELPAGFYDRPVVEVAEELIGCTVSFGEGSGVIVETEAYHDSEPACHAFTGLTPRTETLFGPPGRAYVYRSYGIHALLNAVCEPEGVGAAVLIRALQPLEGIEAMRVRRAVGSRARAVQPRDAGADGRRGRAGGTPAAQSPRDAELCSGPGRLTQALGIWLSQNGGDLRTGPIRIGPRAEGWEEPHVVIGTRVGITKAVELPWRFCVAHNRHVSRPRPTRWG